MAVSAVKTEPAPVEEAAKPAGKKGLIKLIVIALAGAAVVGGGAWWYLGHKGGEPATEAKHEPATPPVFYPLDTFTVNLMLVDNPQFLQTGITLKVGSICARNAILAGIWVLEDFGCHLCPPRKRYTPITLNAASMGLSVTH